MDPKARILRCFSRLKEDSFEITGEPNSEYNCIAWAAGDTRAWWWPATPEINFWPDGVPNEETLEAFMQAFVAMGYVPCDSPTLERRYEKVALYTKCGLPTHAARQLADGRWSSKLGAWECITHDLDALEGDGCGEYGQVTRILRRRRPVHLPRLIADLSGILGQFWGQISSIAGRGRTGP